MCFLWPDKLITEFDPDAPIRQGRGLTEDDRKDQQDLLKDVWELIRKGKGIYLSPLDDRLQH